MKTLEKDTATDGWRPNREQANDWLREQILCVFSTLDATGVPMSVTVAFSVTLNGNLIIGTDINSRKSKNVDRDGRVALTITDADDRKTVQLQGHAEKISDEVFAKKYEAEHYRLRPQSLPYKDTPGQCHILIRPYHIKFSDVSSRPWAITEFTA